MTSNFFSASCALLLMISCAVKKAPPMDFSNYGQIVKFKEKEEIQFPDFSLTFLEEVDPEKNAPVKSSRSIRHRYFLVKNGKGEQTIKITHGQLPAAPLELRLDSDLFIIYSYQTPAGENLFPHALYVLKK